MNRPRRNKIASLYLWHRYTGITAAILVLLFAISGLLLQHSDDLNLPHSYIKNTYILNAYGLQPEPITSYKTNDNWVSHATPYLYINGIPVEGEYGELTAAITTAFGYACVVENQLLLLNKQGAVIELLAEQSGLPEAILNMQKVDAEIVIRGKKHNWLADEQFTNWQVYEEPINNWPKPQTASDAITTQIQRHHISHQITVERFLLDLHSGRVFGKLGLIVMDIAAIAMIFLACSGLWIWTQRRAKDKQHAKNK